jgi:tetratricopeptide (TPR) repeat protein
MNHYAKTFLCFGLVGFWVTFAPVGTATEKPRCEAVELVEGNPRYNRLVCKGMEQVKQKRYAEAVKSFETAIEERLFEYPNIELYPRLALTHFHTGNRNKAQENLAKAELSLSVLIGAIRCEETAKGFRLIKRDESAVSSPYQMEISKKMCGAAFESLYTQRTFETTLHDAKLINVYYQARKEIK